MVKANGAVFRSEKMTVPVPSVLRLNYFVKVPYRARATLSRRAVLVRDGFECQYCGSRAENIDHVLPRSRGGPHTWDNVVACCRRCNSKKENRLPKEAGLRLREIPRTPHGNLLLRVSVGNLDPHWEEFLPVGSPN